MNCNKAHKQIYLFGELTEAERVLILQHIDECRQCMEFNESVQSMNDMMIRIGKVKIEPVDSHQLTNRIMNQVMAPRHQSFDLFDWVIHYFELRQVKLAMAGVSIVLIFLFGFEQVQSTQSSSQYSSALQPTSQVVILNARKFQDQLNIHKKNEKTNRLNECKNPFRSPNLDVACLRQKKTHFKIL